MFPYITIDVLLVSLAFTMPLGLLTAAQLSSRISTSLAFLLASGMIGFTIVVLAVLNLPVAGAATEMSYAIVGTIAGGTPIRVALATLLWVGVGLVATVAFTDKPKRMASRFAASSDGTTFAACLIAAAFVPPVFVQLRCQYGWQRFEEYSESMRIGEARSELATVLRLAPQSSHRGRSVSESYRDVQAEYDRIEDARQRLPHPPDSPETALQQARFLAILGHRELALSYLDQFPELSHSAAAAILRGTILETSQAWAAAIDEYQTGQNRLAESCDSPESSQLWQNALRGEGFCRRKAGDLPGAERAYLELAKAAPTGNNALLLAYFYEDTQRTAAARRWIREAVRLDPANLPEADRLERKLTTSHFGCFQAYRQP